MEFYSIDPFGDQRADLRMARLVWAMLQPHSKTPVDAQDFMLFPDDAHDLPDNVEGQEKAWMLKLNRTAD